MIGHYLSFATVHVTFVVKNPMVFRVFVLTHEGETTFRSLPDNNPLESANFLPTLTSRHHVAPSYIGHALMDRHHALFGYRINRALRRSRKIELPSFTFMSTFHT